MLGIMKRPKQPRFLRRHRHERKRARRGAGLYLRLGDRDQPGDPARIVERAVADVVAVDRVAPPEMVPMRGVEHRFPRRSEEHTSELQSLMRISYAVFCLKKKNHNTHKQS